MAGVLIVSSTREDFASQPGVPHAVGDYANLLAIGLAATDFYPVAEIRLCPMPELQWQREQIAVSFINKVTEYARKQRLSLPEAQQQMLGSWKKNLSSMQVFIPIK